MTDQLSL